MVGFISKTWHHSAMVLACAALAACASPQERCSRDINRELSTVNQLVAETEENLKRGFRFETEIRTTRVGVTGCLGSGGFYSSGVRFCSTSEPTTVRRAVPIDPAAEQRKLDGLKTRQQELTAISARAQTVCAERFPS